MCDRLVELREGMARYAEAFDDAVLDTPQLEEVLRLSAAIESIAATLRALAGARLLSGPPGRAATARLPIAWPAS